MSNYGKIEKNIASFLARHPAVKNRFKLIYQHLNHIFYKKAYDHKLGEGIRLRELYPNKSFGQFWGYYDASPMLNGKYLSHRFKHGSLELKKHDTPPVEIWLNDLKVSETTAWNWQQGSRLFWVDKDTIVHNMFRSGDYRAKLLNLQTGNEQFISTPIYAFNGKNKLALGLNFKRLTLLDPSYGYYAGPFNANFDFNDKKDGIVKIDLTKNSSSLLISIDSLKNLKPKNSMSNARHGINHIQIAPSGKRFMFLHQWYSPNGRKFGRLITANIDGSNMYVLSDDGMVSHCNWKNDNEIIGWMFKKDFGNGYFLLGDESKDFKQVGKSVLSQDGHPTVSPCSKYLLTDTYPDRFRMSHVLLYEFDTNKLHVLGSFYTPIKFHDEKRCDLHPRFSDAENITIDTVYKGVREQVELNISHIL